MKYVLLIPFFLLPSLLFAQAVDSATIAKAKQSGPFLNSGTKAYGIRLLLKGIYIHDQQFYFSFRIVNRSRLDYPVDFMHLFVHDKVTAKRTSFQNVELSSSFIDTVSNVPAKAHKDFLIAVPQFTIPASKEAILELFELNGGRNLRLKVLNREIFQARKL